MTDERIVDLIDRLSTLGKVQEKAVRRTDDQLDRAENVVMEAKDVLSEVDSDEDGWMLLDELQAMVHSQIKEFRTGDPQTNEVNSSVMETVEDGEVFVENKNL